MYVMSSRKWVKGILFLAMWAMSSLSLAQQIDLFVGTYTDNNDIQGIYHYDLDLTTGRASLVSTAQSNNPSFLARFGDRLLAVNEEGNGKGTVSLFRIGEGELIALDTVSSNGDHPCHVSWSPDGRLAFVSNYTGGSLQVYAISADKNSLANIENLVFSGSSIDADRQNAPHIHSAFFDFNSRLYVSDLGTDQIYVYQVDEAAQSVTPVDTIHAVQGGGPRHVAFSDNPATLHVLLELTGQVTTYQRRDQSQSWQLTQMVPISDYEFTGEHGAADIKVSPDGRFVYATNRGSANLIVGYTIMQDGVLEPLQTQSVLGDGPRNFNITPDGKFLLVANQKSNEIVVFSRNLETGVLQDTGQRIAAPAPVCIIF